MLPEAPTVIFLRDLGVVPLIWTFEPFRLSRCDEFFESSTWPILRHIIAWKV
jgi:hypothetical protein